ncbi:hypothetical protein Cfor_12248, partial [Coptotermes formosanus]
INDVQDNCILQGGIPAAHKIYRGANTISVTNYALLTGLKRVLSPNHPDAPTVFEEGLLEVIRGQDVDIYWRDNYICPSVEEHKETVNRSKDRVRVICRI